MLAALDTSELPAEFRIFIDRRDAARPTSMFVGCMLNFFSRTRSTPRETRAAVLVNTGVIEPLADLVGRFRIRTFDDAAEAVEWLHPDTA